ncbi:MAG: hypothetical protein BGO51_17980 [Rhodospirillales bacterium 69-11]|nr:hypothetical protein [Rhodospirillales bacterium]MBN8927004.1 hypothetical protein [Rhodospirillales bacterium]OJW20631.1 MAG: hypothetical protein BGO51_17980 [Rhodospirillales bacterium 69-11]
MADPIPAVAEAAATGEIAAIFADIRAVYRVGVVNLIWRHLATIDGALPWAWAALRPSYVDGSVAAAADALRSRMSLPALPALPEPVLGAAGLDAQAMTGVGAVLAAYDRTNAMALVALSALERVLLGVTGGTRVPAASTPSHAVQEIALPPLPDLAALSPDTSALVTMLNRYGATSDTPILASMYRHLAPWPPYLALAWALLTPLAEDGRLATAITGVRAQAAAIDLPLTATAPADPLRGRIAAALAPFTAEVIAKMVAICAMLRRATPG